MEDTPPKKNTGTQSETLLNDIHSNQSLLTENQKANTNNRKASSSQSKAPQDETSKSGQTREVEMKESEGHSRSLSPKGRIRPPVPILSNR